MLNHYFSCSTAVTSAFNWSEYCWKLMKSQQSSILDNNEHSYRPWNLVLIPIWNLTWSTYSIVVDAIPPMSDKFVDIWQQEFQSIEKWIQCSTYCEIDWGSNKLLIRIMILCQIIKKIFIIEALQISRH